MTTNQKAGAKASATCRPVSPRHDEQHDEHCVEWARHEFHQGRRPVWIPIELLDALLIRDAGNMGPLAAYIRAHGVPLMLNGYVADFLEGKVGKGTRIQQRSAQILHFMWGHRRHHEQELKRIKLDPSYQPMFSTVRAIQEYAAERFYGSADRWATVEKLEQRQKR